MANWGLWMDSNIMFDSFGTFQMFTKFGTLFKNTSKYKSTPQAIFNKYYFSYLTLLEIQNFEEFGKGGDTRIAYFENMFDGSRTMFNLDRFN